MNEDLQAGAKAPAFEGVIQDGSTIKLSDYAGKKVALYFYPRDNTPGCTKQACNLRDNYSALIEAGIQVIGVSGDSVKSHVRFIGKYDLPFPLIADTDKAIMTAYGVWGEKKLYGRVYMGTKRMTFLIEEDGTIQKIIKKPKTGDHTAEVLAGFAG
ncbi:MAG: thioredoxin-dependent thiol peroxidase [Rhodothermia bacterium]